MSRLILAPMEGLADDVLRGVLTRAGRYDWCVTEFVRVSGTLLPRRSFSRICPELLNGARTAAGTPVRVQLMGSDPHCLGECRAPGGARAGRHRPQFRLSGAAGQPPSRRRGAARRS